MRPFKGIYSFDHLEPPNPHLVQDHTCNHIADWVKDYCTRGVEVVIHKHFWTPDQTDNQQDSKVEKVIEETTEATPTTHHCF